MSLQRLWMRVVVAGMLFSLLLLSLPFAVFDALADVDGPWWLGLVTAQALFLATLTRTLLKSEGENGPLPHSAFQAMIDCNIQPMTRAERFLPPAFGVRGSPAGRGYIDGWIETTECTEQVLHRQVQLGGGGAATHGHPRPPNGLAAPQGEKAHRRAAVVVSRARMLRVTSSRNMRQRSPVFFSCYVFSSCAMHLGAWMGAVEGRVLTVFRRHFLVLVELFTATATAATASSLKFVYASRQLPLAARLVWIHGAPRIGIACPLL